MNSGQIIIDPRPEPERIKTSAVDLTLGKEFRRWVMPSAKGTEITIDLSQWDYPETARSHQELINTEPDGSVIIEPQKLILGMTQEYIALPETSRLAARVEGRSSLARIGLAIHLTAPTIHCGFKGAITLEITNHGVVPLRLRPGMAICQLVLEMVFGTPSQLMQGIFQDQDTVQGKPL
ncbi:MAG: dCTP deaminase [Armatimonadota bacterium]|nr:dCTP deaminase [Armatimonadota bacterium]